MTKKTYELKPDGTLEQADPLGSYGPTIKANTKTEAVKMLLEFAYRAATNTPEVKIRNGAYQLAYESMSYGVSVESGTTERSRPICFSGVATWDDLNDSIASFDYYASDEYQKPEVKGTINPPIPA